MTASIPPPHVLVVCTANVCRSPVVEHLLRRYLATPTFPVTVSSAGTHGGRNVVHPDTVAAASGAGVDLSEHESRRLTRRLLDAEGGDLVVALARDHVYEIVATDEAVWPRTFTLPELVRRAEQLVVSDESSGDFRSWVADLSTGRLGSDLLPGHPSDDIVDPYGRSRRHHRRMVREVDELARRLATAASAAIGPLASGETAE